MIVFFGGVFAGKAHPCLQRINKFKKAQTEEEGETSVREKVGALLTRRGNEFVSERL